MADIIQIMPELEGEEMFFVCVGGLSRICPIIKLVISPSSTEASAETPLRRFSFRFQGFLY